MTAAAKLRVMLVDDDRGRAALLTQALVDAGYEVVARAGKNEEILARVKQVDPDVILIDMELPDRDTLEHMRSINRDRPRPVVMFAEKSDRATAEAAIKAGVSAYVVDGLSPARIRPILEVAIARFRECEAMRAELEQTRSQLAERKVIERAKGILMEKRGIPEREAYQALRKLAMDRNKRLIDVAEGVIATAELLS
jgi:response regulator NasT